MPATPIKKVPENCFLCERKRYYSLGGVKSKDLIEKLTHLSNENFELFCNNKRSLGICRSCVDKVNSACTFAKTLKDKMHLDNESASNRYKRMTTSPLTPKFKPQGSTVKKAKTRRALTPKFSVRSEPVEKDICSPAEPLLDEHTYSQAGPGSSTCVSEHGYSASVSTVHNSCDKDITSHTALENLKTSFSAENQGTCDPVINKVVNEIVSNKVITFL